MTARFGPEFTFTNSYILNEGNKAMRPESSANLSKFEELKETLQKRCVDRGDCKVTNGVDKHGKNIRVTYSDGWYFELGIDMAVLEAQTRPGTISDFQLHEARIREDLFAVAKSHAIKPHIRAGGGHIHIGIEAFGTNPLLLRNFFVDYSNRPELAWGALGNHLGNSPPIAALSKTQRKGLIEALRIFDFDWSNPAFKPSFYSFVKLIHSYVYTESFYPSWGGPTHYQAINLSRVLNLNGTATVELRGFRPQESPEHYLLQIELIQARINYLKSLGDVLIPYRAPTRYELSEQEIVNGFRDYVTSTGLEWKRYRVLLPPNLRHITPNNEVVERGYEIEEKSP